MTLKKLQEPQKASNTLNKWCLSWESPFLFKDIFSRKKKQGGLPNFKLSFRTEILREKFQFKFPEVRPEDKNLPIDFWLRAFLADNGDFTVMIEGGGIVKLDK